MSAFFLSLFFCLVTNNPFFMTLFLLLLAASLGMTAGSLFSKWLYIAIFMIFLGGMMILFFYVVSLTKPQKNIFSSGKNFFLLIPLTIWFSSQSLEHNQAKNFLFDLYNYMNFQSLIYLTIVLFLCLVAVVKISENFKGTLASMW